MSRNQEILSVARQIVATHGMEGLTTKTLSRAIGVSEGALYRHFGSKRDILVGLIDEIEETLFQTLEEAQEKGGSPLEKLERMLRSHISYTERRRGVSFIVISEVLLNGDSQLRQRMRAVIERYLRMVEALVVEGIGAGEINPAINGDAAALVFFGIVQATVTLRHFAETELPTSGRFESLWHVFTQGVGAGQMSPFSGG
ncbi:MAG: TetR/AcrR family transcriptional regulator [Chloroflexi bacterium]|nr:TetR/AcrR family transcriptional regulator [Chloroflexota bacterium]